MDYNKIMFGHNLVESIPFNVGQMSLDSNSAVELAMLQVAYKKAVSNLNEFMQETVKRLKKDGFDERTAKINRMNDIDRRFAQYNEWQEDNGPRPEKPASEELAEADEIRQTKAAYDKELAELNESYNKAYTKKLSEEVHDAPSGMSKDLFKAVIEMMGYNGDVEVEIGGAKRAIPKTAYIKMIAEILVY